MDACLPDGFIGGGRARHPVDSFYVHSGASTFCTPARRFDFETDLDLLYSDMKAPPCLDLLYDLPMWLGARAHSATACLSFRWQFPGLAESGGDFPGPSSSCVAPCLRVASCCGFPPRVTPCTGGSPSSGEGLRVKTFELNRVRAHGGQRIRDDTLGAAGCRYEALPSASPIGLNDKAYRSYFGTFYISLGKWQ